MPQREWKSWMQALGQTIRSARWLTGLTQAELAGLAGVSQGALSRLESARGMFAPLVVVLRVLSALRRPIAALPPEEVTPDVRHLVQMTAASATGATSEPDSGLATLLALYREMSATERERFVRVAEATATAIVAGREGAHPEP